MDYGGRTVQGASLLLRHRFDDTVTKEMQLELLWFNLNLNEAEATLLWSATR
jgi:hypothetical protein